jgi:hypothetical protein
MENVKSIEVSVDLPLDYVSGLCFQAAEKNRLYFTNVNTHSEEVKSPSHLQNITVSTDIPSRSMESNDPFSLQIK